jgi:hypothetical protein
MKLIRRTEAGVRGRVCDPIDPEYLRVAGLIHTDTALGANVTIHGQGRQVYRLYCNRGMWGDDNQMGLLLLEAFPGKKTGEEEIHFLQVSRDGGEQASNGQFKSFHVAFRLEGRMQCRNDIPQSWELSSAMYDYTKGQEGVLIEGTRLRESVRVRKRKMEVVIGKKIHKRALPARVWMSEWNMLRRISRLPFGEYTNEEFCLLEGLTLPKPDAFLTYTGRHEAPEFGGFLQSFSLLGRGIVPFDFWLDGNHRLIACISGGLGRAYIPEDLLIPPGDDFIVSEFNKNRGL